MGEGTHYFFVMLKQRCLVKMISPLGLDVVTKTDKTPVLGRMLSKYVGRKTQSIENDITKASSEVAILVNGEKVHGYTIPNDAIGFNRLLGDIRRFHSANQIIAFIGIDLRHYESRNFLAKEHITKRGNPYARKILFKCVHNIASASHTKPCHIADFYEKRKRQSQVTSTKPHTISSIYCLIRIMYYLITHNKLQFKKRQFPQFDYGTQAIFHQLP